jgi:hypothetical protein
MRDWFRSSAAHNTLTVDDESSSVSAGPFSWQTIARSKLICWISQSRFDYVSAWHDGFGRLPSVTAHTRSILFLKHNYWIVRDQVLAVGDHQLRLWFHFDSRVAPLSSKNNDVYVLGGNGHTTRLQVTTFAPGGRWTEESGWVSSCYGVKEEAPIFSYRMPCRGPQELVTFLLPQASGTHPRPVVREIEANEGTAFEIRTGDQHDVLLINRHSELSGCVETARLASDFDLTWARFATERSRMPDELVLIGGTRLEFEGREILQAGKRIDYLSISTHGDQVRRESESGIVDLRLPVTDLRSLFVDLN